MSKKLRILLSAYACGPGEGSEPGMGWHWALEIARLGHEVCILTRENNLPSIERALGLHGDLRIQVAGYDIPRWMRWWKKGGRGVALGIGKCAPGGVGGHTDAREQSPQN